MIGLFALFRRKRADATAKSAPPDELSREPEAGKAAWLGGGYEKTQDLLAGHDGERVGFRKPVQG